jgi:predicted nucleic acid-binding protein
MSPPKVGRDLDRAPETAQYSSTMAGWADALERSHPNAILSAKRVTAIDIDILPGYFRTRRRFDQEGATDRVQQWLHEHAGNELSISDWVTVEYSSALDQAPSRADRALSRRQSPRQFQRLRAQSLNLLPVNAEDFQTATKSANQHASGLCGGDALHLAIAVANGATLCTLDRRMAEAGSTLGIGTVLL